MLRLFGQLNDLSFGQRGSNYESQRLDKDAGCGGRGDLKRKQLQTIEDELDRVRNRLLMLLLLLLRLLNVGICFPKSGLSVVG